MRTFVCGLIACALCFWEPSAVHAGTIAPGWDLFQTDPTSNFVGFGSLKGVPLGTFNFGGSIGVQNTGNTDTIIHRLASASGVSSSQGIQVEMVALQSESANPINCSGFGID